MTRVRAAVASDASAVAAVGSVAFTRQYEGLVDPANYTWAVRQWYSDEAVEESIKASAADPTAWFLIAERDGELLGFLQYDETGPQPELHRIYVAPSAQGSGVGGSLMNALHKQLAAAAGYVLVVVEGNQDAVRFYQRHGLREEARVDAHSYYRTTAGIVFPTGAKDFRCILMRFGRGPGVRLPIG
jgi:ribosomal protein S18 acetylase RimI-like enzyme